MSLADLKKKQLKINVKKLSIEDFIDDAQAYALGKSIIGQKSVKKKLDRAKANRTARARAKHATFSLSEDCIAQLSELAHQTGINKSKLIRILIDKANSQDDLSGLVDTESKD